MSATAFVGTEPSSWFVAEDRTAAACRTLWLAVIFETLCEYWMRGPKSPAGYFLFNSPVDFPFVCSLASVNPSAIQSVARLGPHEGFRRRGDNFKRFVQAVGEFL